MKTLCKNRSLCRSQSRSGTILVLSAVMMVMLMAFIALSVDVGYMMNVQTEMDRAVDAGALAGAGALPGGFGSADVAARDFVAMNRVGNIPLEGNELVIESGTWHEAPNGDPTQRWFEPGTELPSAVRVRAQRQDQRPLFFANVFGHDQFEVASTSVAMFQPRDIMVVLDLSASMNDDSEFRSIPIRGRDEVEGNLAQIYAELGSPTYGDLAFNPNWMTIPGRDPENDSQPKIHVEYRFNEALVTSTKQFHRVYAYRFDGAYVTYSGTGTWNGDTNVYERVVSYNGSSSRLGRIHVVSGYNDENESGSNRYQESFNLYSSDQVRAAAKRAWSLNGVGYPFPVGSWDEYINYCTSSYNYNQQAGYRYKFGYMSFVNYLLDSHPSHSETPDLWQTSEQPVTAVKNAVDVFIDFMEGANTSDRVGLAVYNAPDGWGRLEQPISLDYVRVKETARQRQAGHYHGSTNIAAGLDTGRAELVAKARVNAVKMIVLMTDGVPTFPNSYSYARDLAIQAAQKCADEEIPVVTVSLGLGADQVLMQEIADMTKGLHYNVPGGRAISEVEEDLRNTFERIAKERPLKLVVSDRGMN